jgi:hypothetical protein
MPLRFGVDKAALQVKQKAKILRSAMIHFNAEVKRKLTYQYLGIWTGTLRNTTGAILKDGVLYFGTDTGYGMGYETGDWSQANKYGAASYLRRSGFTGKTYAEARKERNREASWSGDKRHRPFIKDTIEDKSILEKIARSMQDA